MLNGYMPHDEYVYYTVSQYGTAFQKHDIPTIPTKKTNKLLLESNVTKSSKEWATPT